MSRGGKQPGAGRPKGSTTKPQFRDFVTLAQAKKIMKKALTMAREGDSTMIKFIGDQYFGKAPQSVDVTSSGEKVAITGIVINKSDDKKETGDISKS